MNDQRSDIDYQQDNKDLKSQEVFVESSDPNTVLRSAFADESGLQAFRKFWRVYLVCCAVSLGGMYAGYCGAAAGNIVANPGRSVWSRDKRVAADVSGFIRQMATLVDQNGGPVLDAKHVSFWGGFFYVGQVALQLLAPIISDRFGRKACMWALIALMLVVSLQVTPSMDSAQFKRLSYFKSFPRSGRCFWWRKSWEAAPRPLLAQPSYLI